MKSTKKIIQDYKLFGLLKKFNTLKKRLKIISSFNPIYLYLLFGLFLITPYIPNIPLGLILLNNKILKRNKIICFSLSILIKIIYSTLFLYLILK